MFSRWPILSKLVLGVLVLLVVVGTLAFSAFKGVYAFRLLTKSIKLRAAELPLAAELTQSVCQLRVTVSKIRQVADFAATPPGVPVDSPLLREQFRTDFLTVKEALRRYKQQLAIAPLGDPRIADNRQEQETVKQIEQTLQRIVTLNNDEDWVLNKVEVVRLDEQLEQLQQLTSTLPNFMTERMNKFATEARAQYHTWIALCWITTLGAVTLLVVLVVQFYRWVVRPLGILVEGSRRVARGDFQYRIHLDTRDEVAELAEAMNAMTQRFQQIRDDLDQQVKQRTREVVRSEQMASLGLLAAGVAHEINNPLASVAWAAEALESRLHDIIQQDDTLPDDEHNPEISVLRKYLRRIQDEAFRCKGITERLLDFSRMGEVQRQQTELGELVQGVIEMVQHLGKYRNKRIEFVCKEPVIAEVNPQELKQVALNLITNGLDSVDPGGTVSVELVKNGDQAELVVSDNGCGMTEEVLEHLFEPFFTRRRNGQGTGLGLSITYRIVAEHGGRIEASSDGPGQGSRFRVVLPRVQHENERQQHKQAA